MTWRLIAPDAVTLRSWDNEHVVYNSLSGDTHLIGPAAACILERLAHAPVDTAVLAQACAPDDSTLPIHDLLVDLVKLALIEEAA